MQTMKHERYCARRPAALAGTAIIACALSAASYDPPTVLQVSVLTDGAPGSLRAAIQTANQESSRSMRIELRPGPRRSGGEMAFHATSSFVHSTVGAA